MVMSVFMFSQSQDSCTYKIMGKVVDQDTKLPLAYANVLLQGTTIGTVTDEEGNFEILNLCEKEYDLVFSYIGYKSKSHHHDFHHDYMEILLAPDQTILESIVIEAEYSEGGLQSSTTSKLSGEALESVKTESFAEVASEITGVSMLSTGQNVAKPIIHGLHSNRVLVINNGLRHEFQNWGIDHAPEIDPSSIDEIEVIKGAATVRFGPEALGGVILTSPAPMELSTPLSGEIGLVGKSNGQSGEGNIELRKGFKWLSLMAGGSYLQQGDLQAPNYNLSNTGKEEESYYGGFRIHPFSNLDFEGYYSRFDQNLGILLGSTFSNLEDLERALEADVPAFTTDFTYDIGQPRQEVRHDLYKATARYSGKNHLLELKYGHQINARKEFGLRRGDAPNIDLELVTNSIDLDWVHPDIGPFSGKIGVQWQDQANDNLPGTNTVPFIPNYDSERLGAYLIESVQFGSNTLELGLRYDWMEAQITGREPDNTIYRNIIDYDNLTATLGYKKRINSESNFRTNIGTAWRPPNVAELYRFGQHSFLLEYGLWRYTIDERFDFVSTSEGIQTEEDRAVPSEIGYKWINTFELNREDFQFEATAYINYIENYIFSKPGGLTRTPRGVFVYFIYDQADALFWGADVTAKWKHSDQLSSTIKGSYLWAKQIDPSDFFAGLPPANFHYELAFNPKHKWLKKSKFKLNLDYTLEQMQHPRTLTVEEFLFAFQDDELNRFAEDASDFDILDPPPAFLLAHFSYQSSWKQLSWRFQVKNIFNTSYRNYTDRMRYFADDIGRNFVLSLGYKF